jgi:hypothetical protein
MAYAILRTAKLSSLGNVGGSARHTFRERQTPNADPERTGHNRTTGAQSSREVLAGVKARLATVPTVRKNAVLAVEYFIGASPEWFKEKSAQEREAYFDAAEKWLRLRHGDENVIAFNRQYDETSPHCTAYVVPIDPRGRLNCSYFLDGREKLSLMQTEFAEKVGQRFSLERGIEGSKAKHQTIKQYYAKIQEPVQHIQVTPEGVQPKILRKGLITSDYETPELIAQRITKHVQATYAPALEAAKQHHAEKAAKAAREARLVELRAQAIVPHDLPLEAVLERLGYERDAKERTTWRTPAGRLTVNGATFNAHELGWGGSGAVNLVRLIEQTDFKGAVNLLANEFGTAPVLSQVVADMRGRTEAAARAPKRVYAPPEPSQDHWPRVRHYLTEVRKLGAQIVDRLCELGKLYADRFANAVFVLGNGEGVELHGTGEMPFHGVRGAKQPFTLLTARGAPQKVAFVGSAIEALSLYELGFEGRVMSLAGSTATEARKQADRVRQEGLTVVAAFSNDRAGEQLAAHLGQPRQRIYPGHGKDWNDALRYERATPGQRLVMEQQKLIQQQHTRSRGGPRIG